MLAQEAASSPQGADVEEVIVPGRRSENLRVEIERLEGAVYERFNALNSNDEFDIHCAEQEPLPRDLVRLDEIKQLQSSDQGQRVER